MNQTNQETAPPFYSVLSGTVQISDLCSKYGIKTARFYSWKKKLQKSAGSIFEDRGRKSTADQRLIEDQKSELLRLKDTIAEITTENLELKKKSGSSGRRT